MWTKRFKYLLSTKILSFKKVPKHSDNQNLKKNIIGTQIHKCKQCAKPRKEYKVF